MGLLDMFKAKPSQPLKSKPAPQTDWSRFDNHMKLKVVGESYYQPALMEVSGAPATGGHNCECLAALVLEPENPHDPMAVMVQVEGKCVGHLPKRSARKFRERLLAMEQANQPAICTAFVGRAEDSENPNLGINLRVAYDGPLLAQ